LTNAGARPGHVGIVDDPLRGWATDADGPLMLGLGSTVQRVSSAPMAQQVVDVAHDQRPLHIAPQLAGAGGGAARQRRRPTPGRPPARRSARSPSPHPEHASLPAISPRPDHPGRDTRGDGNSGPHHPTPRAPEDRRGRAMGALGEKRGARRLPARAPHEPVSVKLDDQALLVTPDRQRHGEGDNAQSRTGHRRIQPRGPRGPAESPLDRAGDIRLRKCRHPVTNFSEPVNRFLPR